MAWNIFETLGRIKKNITPKMIIIWAVCFVGLITITAGTTIGVLYLIPKEHGIKIDNRGVYCIEYRNNLSAEIKTTELFRQDLPQHNDVRKNIVSKLQNGGKTNVFDDFFRGAPAGILIEPNNTTISYESIFESSYSGKMIIIWFAAPQYSIGRSATQLNKGNGTRPVYGLFIPLDNTSDRFQEQTWFISTTNKYGRDNYYSIQLEYKVTTYGNYHSLWNYIKDYALGV